MTFLTELYLTHPTLGPLVLLLIYWGIWPGLMFAVAGIFESRPVYLGKGQSRMFWPGDFMLGLVFVMVIGLHAKNPIAWSFCHSAWYYLLTALVHAIIAWFGRIPDGKRYPVGSRNSPTKIAHDFCGYFLSAWLLTSFGIPQIVWSIKTTSFSKCAFEWTVIAVAAVFFLAMTAWDITHPPTSEERLLMHPDKYYPCWRKT